jgi:serralysin
MFSLSALRQLRVVFCAILVTLCWSFVTPSITFASQESDVIDAVNKVRQSQGLNTLSVNGNLSDSSKAHNIIMNSCAADGRDGCTAHTVPGELGLMDRIKATGYAAYGVAENIAWGQRSGERVVHDWMNSPGHKANIENPRLKEIGCNFLDGNNGESKRIYWTCNFGFTKDQDPKTNTSPKSTATPKPVTKRTTKPKASPKPKLSPSPIASASAEAIATPSATPQVVLTSLSNSGLTYEIPTYVRPDKFIQLLSIIARPACWIFPSLNACRVND